MTDTLPLRERAEQLLIEWHVDDVYEAMQGVDAVLALLPSLPDGWVANETFKSVVAEKIQEAMGPLVGSPEYLADPVKLARAKKRQRDAAEDWAQIAVDAMLAARPTPPTASGWQPAETAPRESRKQFLAWGPEISGDGFIVAHWNSGAWWSPAYHTMLDFTHWMPLPAPPEPLETER